MVGLAKNIKIMPSSFCFDSDGKKAVYTSSGIWKELKDGGTEDDQIVNALKDYYVSIGGNAEDVESITTVYDMIEAISSISGSGLPDVDTEDDGDVLGVVNGSWSKTEIPSQLPEVSSSDNGNVLTVVDGVWGKAVASTGLPDVSSSDNYSVLSVINGVWSKYNRLNIALFELIASGNNYALKDTSITFENLLQMMYTTPVIFVWRFNNYTKMFLGCGYRTYSSTSVPLYISADCTTLTSSDTPTLSLKLYEVNKNSNRLDYVKDLL